MGVSLDARSVRTHCGAMCALAGLGSPMELSPVYDVMPRATLASERRLHLGIWPKGRTATLNNAFAGREMFTLSADLAGQSTAGIWQTVRERKVYFEQYDVPADQIERIAPAFRHIDDISTPALRKLIP